MYQSFCTLFYYRTLDACCSNRILHCFGQPTLSCFRKVRANGTTLLSSRTRILSFPQSSTVTIRAKIVWFPAGVVGILVCDVCPSSLHSSPLTLFGLLPSVGSIFVDPPPYPSSSREYPVFCQFRDVHRVIIDGLLADYQSMRNNHPNAQITQIK